MFAEDDTETWDQQDEEGQEEPQLEEGLEDEDEIPKPKKPSEAANKVRKDHVNVVFIGHVGKNNKIS